MLAKPSVAARHSLSSQLSNFLSDLPDVERCFAFGSETRGDHDRWSDIDLLLVVSRFPACCWDVLAALSAYRPWRKHTMVAFSATTACMLGTVFRGESVFHKVDLNFMETQSFERGEDLARFDPLLEHSPGGSSIGEYPPDAALVTRLRLANEADWSV